MFLSNQRKKVSPETFKPIQMHVAIIHDIIWGIGDAISSMHF